MKVFSFYNSNRAVIEQTVLDNYNRYYRMAYSYVKNEADASDIVQNGACRAIRKAEDLRKQEYAQTWVYRIMLNEIFRFLGEKKLCPLEYEEMPESPQNSMEEQVEHRMDLAAALDMLPAKDRAVIQLRYYEDRTLQEIAEILEENQNTVKSRLYRSVGRLRKLMEMQEEQKQTERRWQNE